MNMESGAMLLTAGALLLSVAAFMGFAQARTTRGSHAESMWRVVHNGGTAGGVQLLTLSAVWAKLSEPSAIGSLVALCIGLSSWLFFVGPLLKVLNRPRSGNFLLWAGAFASVPGYFGLIALTLTSEAVGIL